MRQRLIALVCAVVVVLTGCNSSSTPPKPPVDPAMFDPAMVDAISKWVTTTMSEQHLNAVLVRVTVDGREIITSASGHSMTGVPATTDMHFRNGAVAIWYLSTLLLKLVDEKKVSLDDKLGTWLPDFPHANEVTLGQLAQMTSGYPDFVLGNDAFSAALYADPFRQWTTDDQLDQVRSKPLLYPPGTNWNYAHTNYVLLGLALAKATGQDIPTLLQDKVLGPLGLTSTANSDTPAIPAPVLHAFSSERREALGIPPGTPFYEESTFWNPSWTLTHGAIQTTTIADVATSMEGLGSGKVLSPESYRTMVSTDLRGKTHKQPGCPTCDEMTDVYTYGMGVVISGNWLVQNPLFGGYAAVGAYLPSQKVAIAVAVTYAPGAFAPNGDYSNVADTLFRRIGAIVAPTDAPPVPPPK